MARRSAVIGLAEMDTAEAWALVFERGLDDRAPGVADEAQLRLGRASVSGELEEPVDSKEGLRSKDELVRLRVVEAMGRIEGALPGGLLERALKDGEAGVRAAAAHALGRRARAGRSVIRADPKSARALHATAMGVVQKDKDDRAGANAIAALPSLTDVLELEGADLSAASGAVVGPALVRAAGLRALAVRGLIEREALSESLLDGRCAVVTSVIDILAAAGDADAMRRIARPLGESDRYPLRSAMQRRILRVLRSASGLSHGPSAERWRRWADGLDEDWRAPSAALEPAAAEQDGDTMASYGLRIVSDRVAFLFDMSGSMWSDRAGAPRKDVVDVELEKALRRLPPTARFNLVPSADAPAPWKEELVPATKKSVERAIEALRGSGLRGKGNVWDALIPVLRGPEVDTVVLLTDGAPTGGARWSIDLMRILLQDENRLRGITIHAILFDASKGLQRRWRGIADDSGGTLLVID